MIHRLTRDQLNQVIELADDDYDDVRTDYSGRGMTGQTCLGYTGHQPEAFTLALTIVVRGYADRDNLNAYDVMDIAISGPAARSDSMGMGQITYWPSVSVKP